MSKQQKQQRERSDQDFGAQMTKKRRQDEEVKANATGERANDRGRGVPEAAPGQIW